MGITSSDEGGQGDIPNEGKSSGHRWDKVGLHATLESLSVS